MRTFHTIPVPRGWSVEQAWEAISRGVELTDPWPHWANIETEDGRFVRVLPLENDEDAPMRDPYFDDMTPQERVAHVRHLAGNLVDLLDAVLGPFGPGDRPRNRSAEITELMDDLAEGMTRIRSVFGAGDADPDDPWMTHP